MRMLNSVLFVIILIIVSSCSSEPKNYNPGQFLNNEQQSSLLRKLAPYTEKPPVTGLSIQERHDSKYSDYYKNILIGNDANLSAYYPADTATFFMIKRKEVRSLYDDYRVIGGYFKFNKQDSIADYSVLYVSSMHRASSIDSLGNILFEEMIDLGNVNKYLNNFNYIEWPNKDVEYDRIKHDWVIKDNEILQLLKEVNEN